MITPNKKESSGLTLVEAVETLSNIADLELNQSIGIAQKHELTIQETPLTYHTVHWLHAKEADETINMIKSIFKVILNYLQDFYNNEYANIEDTEVLERIKTIMVLVGEAAKKLDKYSMLFHKAHANSITDLKEYKKLQEFYLTHISKKIDEGKLGKWILALAHRGERKAAPSALAGKKSAFTKHLFIDLDSVKRDSEYELFYMKKEDGSRFFSPRLIRNLKLVSDFGEYFIERREDPFEAIPIWRDKLAHACAREIIRSARRYIEKFYLESFHIKDDPLVNAMRKLLMGLTLAANPQLLAHELILKSCGGYFSDFLYYLRDLLRSIEFQHLITYPPKKATRVYSNLLDLGHLLCKALYTHLSAEQELVMALHESIQKSHQAEKGKKTAAATPVRRTIAGRLSEDYSALTKVWKQHASGPINLILNSLEEGNYHEFDPLMLQHIPLSLFSLYIQDAIYRFERWPSPTSQEFIHKASVTDEFKGFLRSCTTDASTNKCLIINYQDRGSWRERSRADALEDIPEHETFARQAVVLTLPKDSAFYHQVAPFHEYAQAALFKQQLKEQVLEQEGSFWLPEQVKPKALSAFIDPILAGIHHFFFGAADELTRDQRLDFIEIFYLFFQLKLIEMIKPDFVGLVCKDGVDLTSTSAALLFIFIKLLSQERLSENDQEQLDWMLYSPGLLYRERLLQQERFNRLISAVQAIESVREQYGRANFVNMILDVFGIHFHSPILQAKAVVQRTR